MLSKRDIFFLAFQPKIFEIWCQDTQRFAEKKFLKRWNYTIHELVENQNIEHFFGAIEHSFDQRFLQTVTFNSNNFLQRNCKIGNTQAFNILYAPLLVPVLGALHPFATPGFLLLTNFVHISSYSHFCVSSQSRVLFRLNFVAFIFRIRIQSKSPRPLLVIATFVVKKL